MPLAQPVQLAALCLGFQLAAWRFARALPARGPGLRFVAGLVLAVPCARAGWGLLYLDRAARMPALLTAPDSGYTLLAAPLGVALAALGLGRKERESYAAAAACALPLGFAVAKAGCAAAGCCGPTAPLEAALLLALHALCARVTRRTAPPLFCLGFGGLRLAAEPFRPVPSFGPPWIPPALLCAPWILAGLVLLAHSAGPLSGERHAEVHPRPGPARAGERPSGRPGLPAARASRAAPRPA